MKKHRFYIAMVVAIVIYIFAESLFGDISVRDLTTTILTIVAGIAFWMEFKCNEQINEAQLIMELNDQFITNEKLSEVEWALEKYYAQYMEANNRGDITDTIPLELGVELGNRSRQDLVNYLVHLEGVAALVNEGVLHLNVITDLMAYRYFIAVNNPIVQQTELFPYRDYYQGIFKVYRKWTKAMGIEKVPMAEHDLLKK